MSQLFFLDPEWLCCLMAQIVTITEVNPLIDKQGVSSATLWKSLSLLPSLPPSLPPSVPPSSPPPPPLSLIMFSLSYLLCLLCATPSIQLLQVHSLSHLLKEPKFPSEFLPEYIRLLERFEVVLSQTSHTLLIPSPLPKRKPPSILLPPASPGCEMMMSLLSCCFCCCGYFGVFTSVSMYIYMYMRITVFFHVPSTTLPSSLLSFHPLFSSSSPSLPPSLPPSLSPSLSSPDN